MAAKLLLTVGLVFLVGRTTEVFGDDALSPAEVPQQKRDNIDSNEVNIDSNEVERLLETLEDLAEEEAEERELSEDNIDSNEDNIDSNEVGRLMETLEDLTEEAKERELYEELGAEGSMGARIDSVEETLEDVQQVARGHQETASSSGLQRLGCWKDTANRAIPTLEGQDAGLDGANYKLRTDAVRKCRAAAARRGYTVFAVQVRPLMYFCD
ncbi:uncharacterized protein LOC144914692 [Branchiostoma floridae x Branchiostoma belcheri]